MENNESRNKPQVDLQGMHREKNCADCQYYGVVSIWEVCKLFDIQIKGIICNSFSEKRHDNT